MPSTTTYGNIMLRAGSLALGPAHAVVHVPPATPGNVNELHRSAPDDSTRALALSCDALHDVAAMDWLAAFTAAAALEAWRESCTAADASPTVDQLTITAHGLGLVNSETCIVRCSAWHRRRANYRTNQLCLLLPTTDTNAAGTTQFSPRRKLQTGTCPAKTAAQWAALGVTVATLPMRYSGVHNDTAQTRHLSVHDDAAHQEHRRHEPAALHADQHHTCDHQTGSCATASATVHASATAAHRPDQDCNGSRTASSWPHIIAMPWQCVVLVILGVSACSCTRMMKMHTAPLGMDRHTAPLGTGQRKPKKKAFAKKQLKRKRAQQQRQLANIVTPSARPAVTLCTSLRTEVDSVHEQRPASVIRSRADSPKPVLHPDVVRRKEGIHCGSGQVSPADSAGQLAYLSSRFTSLKNAQPRWSEHLIECLTTMKSAAAAAGASHCILAAAALGTMMVLLLHRFMIDSMDDCHLATSVVIATIDIMYNVRQSNEMIFTFAVCIAFFSVTTTFLCWFPLALVITRLPMQRCNSKRRIAIVILCT
jgi:hypothetical protein